MRPLQGQVSRAIRQAETRKDELMARGVCLVPVVVDGLADQLDEADKKLALLRQEFGNAGKAGPEVQGFGKTQVGPAGDLVNKTLVLPLTAITVAFDRLAGR